MTHKILFKLLKGIIVISSVFVGGMTVTLGLLILKLLNGPIDLNEFKNYTQPVLEGVFPGAEIDTPHLTLSWSKSKMSYEVEAKDVIFCSHGGTDFVKIPYMSFKFPFYRLLLLQLKPERVLIRDIDLKLSFVKEEGESDEDRDQDWFSDYIVKYFVDPNFRVRSLIIENARTNIRIAKDQKIKIPGLNITFRDQGRGFAVIASANIHKVGEMTVQVSSNDLRRFKVETDMENINLATLVKNYGFLVEKPDVLSEEQRHYVNQANGSLSGHISVEMTDRYRIEDASWDVILKEAHFEKETLFPKPIHIDSLHSSGLFKDMQLHIQKIELKSAKGTATAHGDMNLSEFFSSKSERHLPLKLYGEAKNVKVDDLSHLWPLGMGEVPRAWVTKNLSVGTVTRATSELEGDVTLSETETHFKMHKLSGIIDASGVKVNYLDGFPHVVNVKGTCHYDPKTFSIDISEGDTLSQKIKAGKITITKMDEVDQDIFINLDMYGQLSGALEIINSKELRFAEKYGLKPHQVKGECATKLDLSFMLDRRTTLDEVKLSLTSKLHDVVIPKIIESPVVDLSHGKLDLSLTNLGMTIKGTAQFNGDHGTLEWKEDFSNQDKLKRDIKVDSKIKDADLHKMEIPIAEFLKGVMPYKLKYTLPQKGVPLVDLSIDLKEAIIDAPHFNYKKEKGHKASADLQMNFENDGSKKLKKMELKGEGVAVVLSGDFSPHGEMRSLDIKSAKIGDHTMSAHFSMAKENVLKGDVNMDYFNFEPFFDNYGKDDSPESEQGLDLVFKIARSDIGKNSFISQMEGKLLYKNKYLHNLTLKGQMVDPQNGAKGPLDITVTEYGQAQSVVGKIENFGALSNAFAPESNLAGGSAVLKAARKIDPQDMKWKGEFTVENFVIKKAPLLARLFKLSTPFGISDFFSNNKDLKFSNFNGEIQFNDKFITIVHGHATGPSVGMTVAGTYDLKKEIIDLEGSVIPAYILNSLIGKIPIIGQVLMGGKDQGLFAITYTMKGSKKDPVISVNPLSALTPGFLRHIFNLGKSSPEPQESVKPKEESQSTKKE